MVQDAKEATNQGRHFLYFHGFFLELCESIANLHPRMENSSVVSLAPKSSTRYAL